MAQTSRHNAEHARPKRRLPILVRHAITLAAVFVIALPLSYLVGQRIIRHQQLGKLDSPDPAVFEQGVGYLYHHAPDHAWAHAAGLERIASLPPERATRVFRAMGQPYLERGEPVPRDIADAGVALMRRIDHAERYALYNHFDQLGLGRDDAVLDALAAVLDQPDDRRFLQAVEFYDSRFLWTRDVVPPGAWLRWALLLSHSDAALTQLRSAELLGMLPDAVDDPRLPAAYARLAASDNATVRAAALDAAAGYARVADDPVPYEQVLIALTGDDNETLARRAWITLGLLNPLSGFRADWRSVEPTIAEAMLWAAVKTNPDRPEPAIEAWDAGLAYEAALALHQSPVYADRYHELRSLPVTDKLRSGLFTNPATVAERLLFWRCLPVLRRDLMWVWTERDRVFDSLFSESAIIDILLQENPALIASACYYTAVGFQPMDPSEPVAIYQIAVSEAEGELPDELWRESLAYVQSHKDQVDDDFFLTEWPVITGPGEAMFYPLPDNRADHFWNPRPWQADLYRQAASHWDIGGITPDISDRLIDDVLRDLVVVVHGSSTVRTYWSLATDRSVMRDQWQIAALDKLIQDTRVEARLAGVLIAGMSKNRPNLIDGVTADFIRQHPGLDLDDLHNYTDAQLADLGLRRVDALTTLLNIAETAPDRGDRYEQIALLKLALWMRGDLGDDFIPEAETMLEDDRLPTSTVLMCLLHMQRPAALYYLFDQPAGASGGVDLYDMFVNQRWWHVFSRLVPDPDLELWLWGDPGAQSFQFEVMRQWVQVNRWRLERGWWPPDAPERREPPEGE